MSTRPVLALAAALASLSPVAASAEPTQVTIDFSDVPIAQHRAVEAYVACMVRPSTPSEAQFAARRAQCTPRLNVRLNADVQAFVEWMTEQVRLSPNAEPVIILSR